MTASLPVDRRLSSRYLRLWHRDETGPPAKVTLQHME